MKILVMGGTRFVGKALVAKLYTAGHELTLFTRGNLPVPVDVEHLIGDRGNEESLLMLKDRQFDLIIDSSGRTLEDTQSLLKVTGLPLYKILYVSSAGVYSKSNIYPISEKHPVDPSSRHIGKFQTESWLQSESIPFTSFRPTYIYGPGNYNPIERWFFDRISYDRPVPMPGNGETLTQLGHVDDLAEAMFNSIHLDVCINKIYNCSSSKAITFRGLIETAIIASGKRVEDVEIRSFDTSSIDSKARKLFPVRLTHFYTDITNICTDLSWRPSYDLLNGMTDSYKNDYLLLDPSREPDFSGDKVLFSL